MYSKKSRSGLIGESSARPVCPKMRDSATRSSLFRFCDSFDFMAAPGDNSQTARQMFVWNKEKAPCCATKTCLLRFLFRDIFSSCLLCCLFLRLSNRRIVARSEYLSTKMSWIFFTSLTKNRMSKFWKKISFYFQVLWNFIFYLRHYILWTSVFPELGEHAFLFDFYDDVGIHFYKWKSTMNLFIKFVAEDLRSLPARTRDGEG
jgi:hypothetical protein